MWFIIIWFNANVAKEATYNIKVQAKHMAEKKSGYKFSKRSMDVR